MGQWASVKAKRNREHPSVRCRPTNPGIHRRAEQFWHPISGKPPGSSSPLEASRTFQFLTRLQGRELFTARASHTSALFAWNAWKLVPSQHTPEPPVFRHNSNTAGIQTERRKNKPPHFRGTPNSTHLNSTSLAQSGNYIAARYDILLPLAGRRYCRNPPSGIRTVKKGDGLFHLRL